MGDFDQFAARHDDELLRTADLIAWDDRARPMILLGVKQALLEGRSLRPDADQVSFGIAERRDPQTALGARRRRNRAAVLLDALQRLIDVLDVHEWPDSTFAKHGLTGNEMSNDMARGIRKGRLFAIPTRRPAEHGLIEVSRPRRRNTGDV
jgi:hypothetical protein